MESFKVEGMGCASCVTKISRAIQGLDKKAQIEVVFSKGQVIVQSNLVRDEITKAIHNCGFTVLN